MGRYGLSLIGCSELVPTNRTEGGSRIDSEFETSNPPCTGKQCKYARLYVTILSRLSAGHYYYPKYESTIVEDQRCRNKNTPAFHTPLRVVRPPPHATIHCHSFGPEASSDFQQSTKAHWLVAKEHNTFLFHLVTQNVTKNGLVCRYVFFTSTADWWVP